MTCNSCGEPMPQARAEFLFSQGKRIVCVNCSTEKAKTCFTSYDHKTAGHLVIVGTDPEQIRLAERAYKRKR
jgi:hypothetical protein